MPYRGNFPGPFLGKSEKGMEQYMNEQTYDVNNYKHIASEQLPEFVKHLPKVNDLECSNYMQNVRMFPPFYSYGDTTFKRQE